MPFLAQGDGPVVSVLVMQVEGLEFESPEPKVKLMSVIRCPNSETGGGEQTLQKLVNQLSCRTQQNKAKQRDLVSNEVGGGGQTPEVVLKPSYTSHGVCVLALTPR